MAKKLAISFMSKGLSPRLGGARKPLPRATFYDNITNQLNV